jgi:uncharacterized membrane protein
MLLRICEWLQHNGFIVFVNSSVITASTLEIIHFVSFFVLVGSLVAVDLRILGLAARKMKSGSLVQYAFPWMWTGFAIAVISGFLMFSIDATEYLHNTVFHEKLYSLLFTLIFAIVIQNNVEKWDRSPQTPVFAKLIALLCLVSAVAMILMGVDVPALTGVG